MQHLLTPYAKQSGTHAWWEDAFTGEELDWLQQKAKEATQPGIVGRGEVNADVRRSKVGWLKNSEETLWVYERLAHVVSSLNADYFSFDLTGFGEELQLANYQDSEQGTYNWHIDFGKSGVSRKLSLAMQLSRPEEYEGGTLQLTIAGEPVNIEKKRGLIVAFPSWTLHRVTPVVRGNRQSLVTWVTGPQFR